jgi:hypothetical protein
MRELQKVISGGQTGVDQAALRAATECGLEIGGWCPPGRVCESGVIPAEFPLQETPDERSPDAPEVRRSQRTEWNVRDSDGTLVLRSHERSGCVTSAGTEWTIACAARYQRALLVLEIEDKDAKKKIEQWLTYDQIKILNVAGRSEGAAPGIGEQAYALLKSIFATANELG